MIVWGGIGGSGFLNDGGRYNPAANSWTAVTHQRRARRAYLSHGGVDGQRDDRLGRRWQQWLFERRRALQSGGEQLDGGDAPTARPPRAICHTAVWTGSEMIVWGGYNGSSYFNDGGRYNPAADSWTAVTTTGAPAARDVSHGGVDGQRDDRLGRIDGSVSLFERRRALQSGGQQLDGGDDHRRARRALPAHGGVDGQRDDRLGRIRAAATLNDGGRYNPAGNSWTAVTTTGAPAAR